MGKRGAPTQEMMDAVNELAAANGWSPQDILTTYSFETDSSMDPWQKGPTTKWGVHRGLIQWGEPQREKYGVTKDMSVRDQVMATGRYFKDRGVKYGDGLLPMYASINAGHASKIHASDTAAGGTWGTVLDKVNHQMDGHSSRAGTWLDPSYVHQKSRPQVGSKESAVPPESKGVPPEASVEPTTNMPFMEGEGELKDENEPSVVSTLTNSIVNSFASGNNKLPMPNAMRLIPPPPPMRRSQKRPPLVLVKRKEKKT
tara:strand:+ start:4184 stop:4954 length:771 start_codon:yes stop_codon:yes gene_type:complete